MKRVNFAALVLATAIACRSTAPPKCGTADTVRHVLRAFETHRLVLLGEQHQRKEFHEFLQSLIRNPRFAGRVDDIVIEFGNARYQQVVDHYISGEPVDLEAVRPAWRDTTQLFVWDSPMYEQFYATVRDVNRTLPPDRRIRVLLGDPPIDWQAVTGKESYGRFAERDLEFADVVDREVLSKGRRALVVIGGMHIIRTAASETRSNHPGVGDILEARHPGVSYAIFPSSRPLAGFERCDPLLLPADGAIGSRRFGEVMPAGIRMQRVVNGVREWVALEPEDWPPIREKVDAVLWLGPGKTIVPPPESVTHDDAYVRELHRRGRIMSDFFGLDLTADLPLLPH